MVWVATTTSYILPGTRVCNPAKEGINSPSNNFKKRRSAGDAFEENIIWHPSWIEQVVAPIDLVDSLPEIIIGSPLSYYVSGLGIAMELGSYCVEIKSKSL